MNKLKKLISLCKGGVYLTINKHKDYYLTAQQQINDMRDNELAEIQESIKTKMIETDTIVELIFYPDSPVGSYGIYHYDVDCALEEALSTFEEENA